MSAFARLLSRLQSSAWWILAAAVGICTGGASVALPFALSRAPDALWPYRVSLVLGVLAFVLLISYFVGWRRRSCLLASSVLAVIVAALLINRFALWYWPALRSGRPRVIFAAVQTTFVMAALLRVLPYYFFRTRSYSVLLARSRVLSRSDVALDLKEAIGIVLAGRDIGAEPDPPPPPPDYGSNPNTVRIFYGTNRVRSPLQSRIYSGNRGKLSYGQCVVSIPPGHQLGELEGPLWRRFEFAEDPRKHIVVAEESELDATAWRTLVKEISASSTTRQALLFVHGFNVSFKDAARQTAQIAFDLKFKGVPAFFSWPSRGGITPYPADEASVEAAEPFFLEFLISFLDAVEADQVFVIAHSMGNRLVTKVVSRLPLEHPVLARKIRHVILAAPDIDVDVFKLELGPRLVSAGLETTMYASSRDRALQASKRFHQYQRAGDTLPSIVVVPGIDTIDASEIDTGFIGLRHSYYARKDSILSDITYVLLGVPPIQRHRLAARVSTGGSYYYFVP